MEMLEDWPKLFPEQWINGLRHFIKINNA